MKIIGCDLHARQQTLAVLDTETGEIVNLTLTHEGDNVRGFYSKLPRPVRPISETTNSLSVSDRVRSIPRIFSGGGRQILETFWFESESQLVS